MRLRDGTRLDVRRTPGLPDVRSGHRDGRWSSGAALGRRPAVTTRSAAGLAVARTLVGDPVTARRTCEPVSEAAAAGVTHSVHVAVVRNHGRLGRRHRGDAAGAGRPGAGRLGDGGGRGAAGLRGRPSGEDFSPDSGCGLGGSFGPVVERGRGPSSSRRSTSPLEPHHLVVLVPDECETGAVGTGSIGSSLGSGGVSVSSLEQDYGETTLAHELGHNFGLDHSGAEVCDGIDGLVRGVLVRRPLRRDGRRHPRLGSGAQLAAPRRPRAAGDRRGVRARAAARPGVDQPDRHPPAAQRRQWPPDAASGGAGDARAVVRRLPARARDATRPRAGAPSPTTRPA